MENKQRTAKQVDKKYNCYHYKYLPFIESDLGSTCGYCKENQNVAGTPNALGKLFDSLPAKDKARM